MNLRAYRNEIRWTIVVVVLAVLGVIALWPRGADQQQQQSAAPAPAPAARAVDPAQRAAAALQPCPAASGAPGDLAGVTGSCLADGQPADVGAAVAGGTTLINLWATWCAPCRTELPALQAYADQPGAVRVLGVQVQSDPADGLDLLTQLGVHFPNVHDGDSRVRVALKAPNVLPMSYVVTASGEVRRIDPPVVFKSPDDVRAAVERTLGSDR
ncbi:TlpA disulfide reductase family protein [Saccharopolyspora sp. ASAGF58]|uniref:TlpA family protein disulfide reductase n=1 Tax=Saccharopolyspora sp. ASAGF58 TaxID=2719023 RepID=UPI00143FCF51|nr:TlpA disulfide reductase family protein [Saccharopolyspora sp. ASAGF58]QIZ35530.1 TlpA family protein disulfide reductase [Saccharopolyspora sp. ASAGF58]